MTLIVNNGHSIIWFIVATYLFFGMFLIEIVCLGMLWNYPELSRMFWNFDDSGSLAEESP